MTFANDGRLLQESSQSDRASTSSQAVIRSIVVSHYSHSIAIAWLKDHVGHSDDAMLHAASVSHSEHLSVAFSQRLFRMT